MKTRREFIRTGVALGVALPLVDVGDLFAGAPGPPAAPAGAPVLAAVRDGDRVGMLNHAIATLGGMGAFVRPGQTVVIKPNISFDAPPEHGSNTHPDILRRLVVLCQQAGARSVTIVDNTLDPWPAAIASSGAEAVARETGAALVNGSDETLYREVSLPDGRRLRSVRVNGLILDSDVFINVPVLKHHGGALMTAGMKNLMGTVWERKPWHRDDLHQCIADFLTLRRPNLTVVDAYHPMVRHGPRGRGPGDLVEMRMLLASADVVAVDAACARILGHQPSDVRHVKLAGEMKLGIMDLAKVDIRRFKLA